VGEVLSEKPICLGKAKMPVGMMDPVSLRDHALRMGTADEEALFRTVISKCELVHAIAQFYILLASLAISLTKNLYLRASPAAATLKAEYPP
jgi:hypothetical protein